MTKNWNNRHVCVNDQLKEGLSALKQHTIFRQAQAKSAPPIRVRPRRKRRTLQFESMAELMAHTDGKRIWKALEADQG